MKDTGTPLDILLVDDNEDDIFLMREAFDQERVVNLVKVARDGPEALEYLRDGRVSHPALVLLDINMPKMNGFEVLREMKNDRDLQSIPVAMLTTSEDEIDVVKSYAEGACSFITKPITLKQLHEVAHAFSFYWTLVARVPAGT